MKLSVVILNYNVRYFLEQCLRSVQRAINNIEAEIIVIDNNSKDDSCKMVKELFPEVILIENKENVGFSKANNQAVAIAKGEYICILNPDTAVAEDTFEQSLKYYRSQQNVGALGVYLMDGTGNFLPESKRNLPTPKVSLLKLIGLPQKYYAAVEDEAAGKVEVLVGAYMFLAKSIYENVNGFDEDYFMYGEDIDLSYKITKAGFDNHYLGSAKILHYKGESTKKNEVYFDRFYGAMQIFYQKHFDQNPLLRHLVNVGVSLAKMTSKLQTSKSKAAPRHYKKGLVVSQNQTLVNMLVEKLDIDMTMTSKEDCLKPGISNCVVIFDAEYISYKDIFECMARSSQQDNIFRIRPPKANFIIGSDQSDEKGGVIIF